MTIEEFDDDQIEFPLHDGWFLDGDEDEGYAYYPDFDWLEYVIDDIGQLEICPPGGFEDNRKYFAVVGFDYSDEFDEWNEAVKYVKKCLKDLGYEDEANEII